jgi:CRP/FNR family cyclic AMP-dependent transcriptional regulator
MSPDLIVRQLLLLPIFRKLTLRQLNEIASNGEPATHTPGSTVVEQDAVADAAVLLFSGEAVRVAGPELKERMEPIIVGSLLCESAMLVETQYGSTVVARSTVSVLRILRDKFHAQIRSDPEVGDRLVQNLVGRLQRLGDGLREVDAALAGKHPPVPTQPMQALARALTAASR